MKKQANLEILSLKFPNPDDDDWISFLRHFKKSVSYLVSLNLDFENCDKITDEGHGELLSQGLSSLRNLKRLG